VRENSGIARSVYEMYDVYDIDHVMFDLFSKVPRSTIV
jgi:hypothetical protein